MKFTLCHVGKVARLAASLENCVHQIWGGSRGGSMDAITLAEVIAWSDACLDVPQDQWPAVEALHATYRRTVNLAGAESSPKPSAR